MAFSMRSGPVANFSPLFARYGESAPPLVRLASSLYIPMQVSGFTGNFLSLSLCLPVFLIRLAFSLPLVFDNAQTNSGSYVSHDSTFLPDRHSKNFRNTTRMFRSRASKVLRISALGKSLANCMKISMFSRGRYIFFEIFSKCAYRIFFAHICVTAKRLRTRFFLLFSVKHFCEIPKTAQSDVLSLYI